MSAILKTTQGEKRMKINKKKIVKNIGFALLTTAITMGSGIIISDSLTNHQDRICEITYLENSLGLDGTKHQITRIEEDYKSVLGYVDANTYYVDEYYPKYLSFEDFHNGLCHLYNVVTNCYEDVNVNTNDYDISVIGVKKTNDDIEVIEPTKTTDEKGNVSYTLPVGYEKFNLYISKKPEAVYITKGLDKNNNEFTKSLILK